MSDVKLGKNRNVHDEATISAGIVLNATTSTIIAPANDQRIFFHVNNNDSSQDSWIKLQAATVDNVKKGIFLQRKGEPQGRWEMPSENIYTGEISAIAETGTPTIYVTEY